MGLDRQSALGDIDAVLARTFSGAPVTAQAAKATTITACIRRYVDKDSAYWEQAEPFLKAISRPSTGAYGLAGLRGILEALRADIDAGALLRARSLILGEVFADLLEQADHLVKNSYRRAAAVLAGATLEEHLRKLAARHAIEISDSSGTPRKAAAINADLYTHARAYAKTDHAQVDAWQKVRNEAAHGQADFEAMQNDADIARMISGIRDFIVKHPA